MADNSLTDEFGWRASRSIGEGVYSLSACIARNEVWLINRTLKYANHRRCNQHLSALRESCKLSISNLSKSLIIALNKNPESLESPVKDAPEEDSIAAFGSAEAERHREIGVDPSRSLSLLKHFRRSYLDLLTRTGCNPEYGKWYYSFVGWFFDHVEMGFLPIGSLFHKTGSPESAMKSKSSRAPGRSCDIRCPIFVAGSRNGIAFMRRPC